MNDHEAAGLIATCLQRAIADEHQSSLAREVWFLGSYLLGAGDPDEQGLRAFCEWDARMIDDLVEWIMSARGPEPVGAAAGSDAGRARARGTRASAPGRSRNRAGVSDAGEPSPPRGAARTGRWMREARTGPDSLED